MNKSAWFRFIVVVLIIPALLTSTRAMAEPVPRAAIWFVSPEGTGTTCSQASPCSAKVGLLTAETGDLIYFKQGTYKETTDPMYPMYEVDKGITLKGGWDGEAAGTVNVNAESFPTIIDGEDVRKPFVIDVDTTDPVEMSGFEIRNGVSGLFGGGVEIKDGVVHLIANTFGENWAGSYGGAVYVDSSDGVTLSSNQFLGNGVQHGGGGVYLASGPNVIVEDNYFYQNSADYGGAINVSNSDGALIQRNIIEDTRSYSALMISGPGSDPVTVRNNIIDGVSVETTPGSGNWTDKTAIEILHIPTSPHLIYHNTLVNARRGIVGQFSTKIVIANNIFAYLTGKSIDVTVDVDLTGSTHNLFYENKEDPFPLEDPIQHFDPLFVDVLNNDFHLTEDSMAIDAGVMLPVDDDLDGDARPKGAGYDIGADEWVPSSFEIFCPLICQ